MLLREGLTFPPARNRIPHLPALADNLRQASAVLPGDGHFFRFVNEPCRPECLSPRLLANGSVFCGNCRRAAESTHPPASSGRPERRLPGTACQSHLGVDARPPGRLRVESKGSSGPWCSVDYYQRAARRVAERSGEDPVFHIFSDDPEWTAKRGAMRKTPLRHIPNFEEHRLCERLSILCRCATWERNISANRGLAPRG